METVESAFFIDPSDQSAWIYHRWLLGREENPPRVSHVRARLVELNLEIVVVLTQPAHVVPGMATVTWQGETCKGEWACAPSASQSPCPCAIWSMRTTVATQIARGESGTVGLQFPQGSILTTSRTPITLGGESGTTYDVQVCPLPVSSAPSRSPSSCWLFGCVVDLFGLCIGANYHHSSPPPY